jgi:DNA polymerase-3 subunit delta'
MSDNSTGFASIRGQKQAIWLLKTLLRKGTIPHALLFTGIEGVGKRTAAMVFAMACLCKNSQQDEHGPFFQPSIQSSTIHRNRPCTQCHACRRVASGNHPDVIRIDPEGAFIRIGQIRALCTMLTMKPYENGFRVVLITDAQHMNPEASNALLKVLEEPPDKTILVLTASAVSELLPTIVSRCQHIQFSPLGLDDIVKELTQTKSLYPNSAQVIAQLANGSMSKAFKLAQSNFISYRKWLLEASGMRYLTEKKIPAWQGLALAEALYKSKEYLNDALEILKSWLRDVLIYPYSPDMIINRDIKDDIKKASKTESVNLLLKKLHAVEYAQKVIAANGNLRLTLEIMAVKLVRSDPMKNEAIYK